MRTDLWHSAGHGTAVWQGDPVDGEVVEIRTPDDVLDLMERDDLDVIILMHTAGAMMLSPIFPDITGVICTAGSVGAHVAIMSRELGVPCIVAADIAGDLAGQRVQMTSTGEIFTEARP